MVEDLARNLPVMHVRLKEKSLSMARNAGLDHATGQIIAFPDDDCWYPSNLLDKVDGWFKKNARYEVLAVGALDAEGLSSGNRWLQNSCDISPLNAMRTTFASSLFICTARINPNLRFDPRLPAARKYGMGMGIVVRRHSLILVWCGLIMYDLARTVLVSARGQFENARFCLAHTSGLFRGFVLPESTYE
jgi:glycosyltransferase involved in cell wall biosynthesis